MCDDSREERLIRIEDTIVYGEISDLHSEYCRISLADATNPFAVARLMHANGKSLEDLPTVCVSSLEMAETITSRIEEEARSLLAHSQEEAIEIVLPACGTMPEILGDGFPYNRIRIFEEGIMHEIIAHVARPLAMYTETIQYIRGADYQSASIDSMALCRELQVPKAITILFDAHQIPVVIDSSGKSEHDVTRIIGKHELAEQGSIPRILERSGVSRYRPKTPMLIVDVQQISIVRDMALRLGVLTFGKVGSTHDASIVKNLSPTGDTIEAAARLYPSLRAIDNVGLQIVIVERLPDDGFGSEINERLRTVAFDVYQLNEMLNMCS